MRWPVLFLALCSIAVLIGCRRSDEPAADVPDSEPAAGTSTLEASNAPNPAVRSGQADNTLTSESTLPAPGNGDFRSSDAPDGGAGIDEPRSATAQSAETGRNVPTDRLQLAPDLNPQELVQFLGKADREMREVARGATSAAEYAQSVPELKRLANLKLTAAQRLAEQPSVSPGLLRQAKRGRLQALSHLAAMEDLNAADELETYAKELSSSPDPMLAVESRMVLIGFELEDLQDGSAEDPDRVVQLVGEVAANAEMLAMPALMAISQARSVLQQYGYREASQEVQDQIVRAFSDHPDPQVAAMAAQMAGAERFDRLDALRRAVDEGETVSPDHWKRAASELVQKNADRSALQYLATAALGFESEGKDALADATYEVLRTGFTDSDDPSLLEERELILDSYAARQSIIGQPLEIDFPDLQGEPIDWSDYRGQIVLIPFWAAEYPDSIQIFPLLEQLRAADTDQIAILGVNLDINDASVLAFTSRRQPDWASVRSTDADQRGAMNPLATQVGLASMPFVVVVGRDGNVVAVSMSGSDLEQIVSDLLEEA